MKIIALVVFLFILTTTGAQNLVFNNGHFMVLYADEGASVTVKENTEAMQARPVYLYTEFINEKGGIKARILTEKQKPSGPFEQGLHKQWPEHIKINNNGNFSEPEPGDSIIYDKSGRISEVHSGEDATKKHLRKKFFYKENNQVYEFKPGESNGFGELYLYKLDPNGNIQSRLFAESEDDLNADEIKEEKIKWKEEIEFKYHPKTDNLPVRINWYKFSGKSKSLFQYQTFITVRNKVTSSRVFEKSGSFMAISWDQRYIYSNW